MQQSCVYMVIVNNEEGVVIGLVMMEDILEEIVGDIKDEYEYKDLVNLFK